MNTLLEDLAAVAVNLPPRIDREVRRYISYLREAAEALDRGRMADRLSGGAGRSESEVWQSQVATVTTYREMLAEFRTLAEMKGLDAETAIRERGGPVNLWITAAAYQWLQPAECAVVLRHALVKP